MGDYLYMLTLTVVGVGLFAFLDKARGAVIIASCLCGELRNCGSYIGCFCCIPFASTLF